MNFDVAIDSSRFELRLEYDGSELSEDLVDRMGAYYASTFGAMVADPQARYEQHSPLADAERDRRFVGRGSGWQQSL